MRSPHSLTVISLGGDVQSSVMTLMADQGAFDAAPRLRHLRRHPLGAAQGLRPPGMARRPAALPSVRRGQRAQPPRGREGPHQPLRLPQRRGRPRHASSDGPGPSISLSGRFPFALGYSQSTMPLTAPRQSGYDAEQKVGPATLQTPRAVAPPD